jgi:LysR family transcriptional regulator, hydrogen peroxide-inducible genes activator
MGTLTQLGYAVAVDQHRNFRRAAAACFVTQPTLSMGLHKLEDELGVQLFDRTRKPVEPTLEGEVLLEQFRAVLRESARVEDLVQEMRGEVAGIYRLGIIPTMASTILPRLLPPFLARHPRVELRVRELTTDQIVAELLTDTLDGGILAGPLKDERLFEFPLGCEPLVLYRGPSVEIPTDPEGRALVGGLPVAQLLLMGEGHCLRSQTLDLCELGKEASAVQSFSIEAGSVATLCGMVRQGPFFTVLPGLAALELREQGRDEGLMEIAGEVPFRQIALATRRGENRRAVREALATLTSELLGPLLAQERACRPEAVPPR